jgi:RNA polymerase sigma-70 factor (ECF subfamily)
MSERTGLRIVPAVAARLEANDESAPSCGAGPGMYTPRTETDQAGLARSLHLVARGDREAFDTVYREMAGAVYGLIRRVLRDPAQAEEVAQEVMVEVWRSASRFDQAKGSPRAWMLTIAHRRAVDRVRAEQSAHDRETKVAARSNETEFDEVSETVEARLEAQRVRHCLGALTDLQRESVTLAYYGGYTYPQVAELLGAPLGTVKTRMRDGLTRLRDCLGVGR